jgi:hypothetical protein
LGFTAFRSREARSNTTVTTCSAWQTEYTAGHWHEVLLLTMPQGVHSTLPEQLCGSQINIVSAPGSFGLMQEEVVGKKGREFVEKGEDQEDSNKARTSGALQSPCAQELAGGWVTPGVLPCVPPTCGSVLACGCFASEQAADRGVQVS